MVTVTATLFVAGNPVLFVATVHGHGRSLFVASDPVLFDHSRLTMAVRPSRPHGRGRSRGLHGLANISGYRDARFSVLISTLLKTNLFFCHYTGKQLSGIVILLN